MARKHTHVAAPVSPAATDDFTRIRGIGPSIDKRLHSVGISTFAQFAMLPAETIAALIPNVSAKQVAKQNWIRQAHKLGSSAENSGVHEQEVILTSRQHYSNFTLEFLLDAKDKIRRIQAVHIQSGDVDTWTKWDNERLTDFLARHAATRLPSAKPSILMTSKATPKRSRSSERTPQIIAETTPMAPIKQSGENIDSMRSVEAATSMPPMSALAEHSPMSTVPQNGALPAVSAGITNAIRLLEWKTLLSNTNQALHNLSHDQAFNVNLTLDLTDVSLPDTSQIDFTALLYAKRLGDGPRRVIGETQGTVPFCNTADFTFSHATLPQGLYRLEAFLTLIPKDSPFPRSGINTSFQGGLLQVY